MSIKCAELPLSLNSRVPLYVQVKSKQILLQIELEQDVSLIPEETKVANTKLEGEMKGNGAAE